MATCCVASTKEFFFNPASRTARFFQSHEGQDKLLKFGIEGVIPLTAEIALRSGASSETMGQIGKAHEVIKVTRDVTGMLNIFRGIIPALVLQVQQTGLLLHSLWKGDEHVAFLKDPSSAKVYDPKSMVAVWNDGQEEKRQVVQLQSENDLPNHFTLKAIGNHKHNEMAVGWGEKLLKLGANAGSIISCASYIAGFGAAKPAANVRKYFKVDYGVHGSRLAESFPYLMMGCHAGGTIHDIFELGYQFMAYERAIKCDDVDTFQVKSDFWKAVTEKTLHLMEQVLELLNDSFLFISIAAPTWIKIPLGIGISGLGLVRVWIKTA